MSNIINAQYTLAKIFEFKINVFLNFVFFYDNTPGVQLAQYILVITST